MICSCLFPIQRIPGLFAPLKANLDAAGSPSADAQASGKASLDTAAQSAASGNAALNTALSASSLAKLETLANFTAAMNSAFGIDLKAPGAAAQFAQLLRALMGNGFGGAIGGMPFPQLPQLAALGSVANGMNAMDAAAGADMMAGTKAGAQMAAGLNGSLGGKMSLAAALTGGAKADMAAMLNAQAAVKAGLGVNLAAKGGVSALAKLMPTLSSNVSGMPDFSSAASEGDLQKALQMLSALESIKAAFGVDMLQPGAGLALKAAMNKSLAANANLSKSASLSKSAGIDAGKSANLSASKSANAALAGQLQQDANMMHDENLAGVASSAPTVPKMPNLLAAVLGKLMSHCGLDIVQHQPCGKKCMFAAPGMFMPGGCLCPSAGKK